MAAIEVGVKFAIEKLDDVVNGYNKAIEGIDFGKGFELDSVAVRSQFDLLKKELEKALKTGELNLKDLNLPALATALEKLGKKAASSLGQELNDQALAPFKQELDSITNKIDAEGDKLKDITEQQRQLTTKSIKEKTKSETGFGGKVMFGGSAAEAQGYLDKLQKAEADDPQGEARRTKLIEFYKKYVANLKEAEQARVKLNKEEEKVKTGIAKLKAREEELLLKVKKESAKLDAQAPEKYKAILALGNQLREMHKQLRAAQKAGNDEKRKEIELSDQSVKSHNRENQSIASKAISTGIYYTLLNTGKRIMREAINAVKEMDKAMTEAAIVTDMNRKEAWALMGTYQDLARETGVAVSEISGVVVEFLRQGRSMKEALELAEVAAKSAKVAAISTHDAVRFLTSAVNGFGLAADQAESVADKFASVASQSASSFQELATAMSKVAPVAKSAGVGIDFMMGVLAKGLESTREAPENIGTAFKTIFARMREVTDIGKATEDGMSLNRVEKALASVGVPLRDVSGQFRNLEDVLIDVGDKWNTLTSIEQAYIATALAGTRQQPRLLAIFNDFNRTKELIEISSASVGALQFQHIDYMEGMEAATNRLQNAWQGFILALTSSDVIIEIVNVVTAAIDGLAGVFKALNTPMGHTLTILGLLVPALVVLIAKNLMLLKTKIAEIASSAVLNFMLKTNRKNYQGLYNMKMKNIIASLKNTAATLGEAGAAGAATFANKHLTQSFKILAAQIWVTLAPLLPFIAAAAALVAIVALVAIGLHNAGKDADYFGAKIDKLNKRINDLTTKEDKVKKLADRFKELQRVTNKSADDIKEMADIASELQEVTLTTGANQKEQKFNFATVDFTGESVFDEAEYQRFLDTAQAERERLDKIASENFASALARDGADAFENKSIADFARKQGYEAGVEFADALGDGYSDETKAKVKKQLADALKKMDMSIFYKTKYKYAGKEYDTQEEALQAARDAGLSANQAEYAVRMAGTTTGFSEEDLKKFSEKLTKIYADGAQDLQDEIKRINEDDSILDKSRRILLATTEEYKRQIEEAKAQFEGEELKAALAFVAQSNRDAAIITSLIEDREINVDLILNLQSSGLNADAIDAFLSQYSFDPSVLNTGATGFTSGDQVTAFIDRERAKNDKVLDAIQTATSGGADNIEQGFDAFREGLRAQGYTEEEIQKRVEELAQVVQTMSVEQVGTMIKAQGEMTKKAMDLSAQVAKGDFSNFGEIVAEYGLEAATNILNGSEAGIRAVMEKNREKTQGEIAASIAEIYAVEGVDTFDELSDAAKEQVRSLELMAEYYDDIVGFEMLREFRMKQVAGYMKEMNDLLKLQQSLMDLGMAVDNPFIQTLDGMVESLDRLARAKIDKQLQDDLANLEKFGTFDGEGNFIVNPDIDITQANQAIDAAMSTLTTYVQMQTEAFNRQKKAIEEAAKAEIDAAKEAFNERWKAIEYTNKLVEAEEKIFEVRRKVAALAISGMSGAQLAEGQKELRKLEEERRKMIEQQALDEMQKELEAQRDQAIVDAQTLMADAIESYTAQLVEVLPGLTEALEDLVTALDDNTEVTEENTVGPGNFGGGRDRSRTFTDMNFIG